MAKGNTNKSAAGITTALSFCLMANLAPLMTFPAVVPEVSLAWNLSATDSGWIGGIYFAGYAAAVPVLASATDRYDGRWIVAGSSLLGAAAGLAFAVLANGFWLALILRFLGGIALAGVHMPGLKLITERTKGAEQARGTAIYTSIYAVGSAGSFLLAGAVDAVFGWHAMFLVAGTIPLLAVLAIAWLSPVQRSPAPTGSTLAFGSALQNRPFMAYVLGFAGNTWEVFGIRVWFVACLSWSLSLPGNELDLPNLAVIGGLASLAGVPVSIAVAELATKWRRSRVIVVTCLISVAVCMALAATVGSGIAVVLALLILLQITSFADVGALSTGAVALSDPTRRGAALAVYAFAGFTTGFIGPVTIGFAIDWFGGPESTSGWTAAFLVMAIGSSVAGLAIWSARHSDRSRQVSTNFR